MTTAHNTKIVRLCNNGNYYEAMEEASSLLQGSAEKRAYVMMRFIESLFVEMTKVVTKTGA